MNRKRSSRGDLGTTSFALLGVLLILLSIFAISYVSYMENKNYESKLQADRISALEDAADKTLESIKAKLHLMAIDSAFQGSRTDTLHEITHIFHERVEGFFQESVDKGGWRQGKYEVSLLREACNVSMDSRVAEVDSVIPSDEGIHTPEPIATDIPGVLGRDNRSFYYGIEGVITVMVREKDTGLTLNRTDNIDMTVDVPYPFMKGQMDELEGSLHGSQGQVARITRYVLTTVAQYRALMGYGMKSYENMDNSSLGATRDILTLEDVELALNLAILLEMAYQFRTYDPAAAGALVNVTGSSSLKGIGDLEILLDTYVDRGRICPGDIIALFYGYAYDNNTLFREDAIPMNIDLIIAQAIYAVLDQFILKYFDYFGFTGVINIFLGFTGTLNNFLGDVWDGFCSIWDRVTFWTNDDDDEINPKQVKLVRDRVREVFAAAGMTGTYIVTDIYLPFNSIDGDVIYGYPGISDDFNRTYEITVKTRLTSEENRRYSYSCEHEVDDTSENACPVMKEVEVDGEPVYVLCGANRTLDGYEYALHTVEVGFSGGAPVQLQPVDVLNRNDEIWQRFYNEHYTDEDNTDIRDLESLVKAVIERFVNAVTEVDALRQIIQRYNRVEIDVYDRRSLFQDIQVAVNSAIEDTICYFRKNPDVIKEVVMNSIYNNDGDLQIEYLKETLKNNYEKLYGGEDYLNDMTGRTAIALISEENPYVTFDIVHTEIIEGGLNDPCDTHSSGTGDPLMEDLRHIFMFGGTQSSSKLSSLAIAIRPEVEQALNVVMEREVSEVNFDNKHSREDGLIIQALDSYMYNTTIAYDSYPCDTRTRSGSHPHGHVRIESVTPNPATMGQDTVRFRANISCNHTHIEWTSNKDGHLSNRMNFNMSASFMTAGDHLITFRVTDDTGGIHTDTADLFINRPPVAVIASINPSPASQNQRVAFNESSYDTDGYIISYLWEFGDGQNSTEQMAEHVYTGPGTYTVTLTVTDDKGGTDSTSAEILVDNRPYVVEIRPEEGPNWNTDQDITVTFSEEVEPASLVYSISPYIGFIVSWHEENTVAVFVPQGHYGRSQTYTLTIIDVHDVDNGTSSSMEHHVSHSWTVREFTTLTGHHPAKGEEEVKLQRSVVMSFSEPVRLEGEIDRFISGDWGWEYRFENDNRSIVLDHHKFPSGTWITLTMDLSRLKTLSDGSIVTTDGEGDTDFELSFLTEETVQPMLLSLSPANGTRNVSTSGFMYLNFSMPINTTAFLITLYPHVSGLTYQWNHDNTSVVVGYQGLSPGMRYVVYIDASNEAGKALNVPPGSDRYTNPFIFHTLDDTLPYVIATSPWDGQARYLTSAPVVIVFSKSMDPESIQFEVSHDPGGWDPVWNWDHTELKLFHDDFRKDTWHDFSLVTARDRNGNPLQGTVNITFHTSRNGRDIQGSLLQRMVWSVLGGGLMDDSLFNLAENMLKGVTSNIIHSSEMSTLVVRLPMALPQDFRYSSGTGEGMNELELSMECSPGYVHLDGETSVISKPVGVHYTNIVTTSSRPFETYWEVSIPRTVLHVNVSTGSDMILVEDGHLPAWMNRTFILEFDVTVFVSSGWGLAGVDYSMTNTFFSDIKTVLDHLWGFIRDGVSFIIDAIRKLIDVLTNIVETIKEYAAKLLEYLGNMIQYVVDEMITPHVEKMRGIQNSWWFNNMNRSVSILGLNLDLQMSKGGNTTGLPMYEGTVKRYVNVSLGGSLLGTSYNVNLNVLENTVVLFGQIRSGKMDMGWQSDPLAMRGYGIYPAWFQAQGRAGSEGNGALMYLTVPEMKEPTQEVTLALSHIVPIDKVKIPIGPIVVTGIDLGASMVMTEIGDGVSLLSGMIFKTFRETVSAMTGISFSFDYIIQFIKTLIQRFVDEVISLITNFIQELSLFFKAIISGVEVCLTFGFKGGETIISFFQWIATSIRTMIENISGMRPSAPMQGLTSDVLEGTWLGITMGDAAGGAKAFFNANIPALAALVGKDYGAWMMDFGVDLPIYDMILIKGVIMQW